MKGQGEEARRAHKVVAGPLASHGAESWWMRMMGTNDEDEDDEV